ncbi:MAG: peptide-methionine (S)-S-oxide reductase MsrA [Zymomonas mobilis subsp. pomaceae]|uniref:peptide-methionine (S)-S-oxide reductase MsrA n=1 Tax=Zymomonas mobilis TaxID=542 RepID=UPI0039ECD39F
MIEEAILAGGCFWCVEAIFKDVIGISSVESGYIGGNIAHPDYKQVCQGTTGHAEAIRLSFDPEKIRYADILDIFFNIHDATQLNQQGADVGTQYRSAIFPLNKQQEHEAQDAVVRAQAHNKKPVVTTIESSSTFYPAESYHQDYFEKQGSSNAYCVTVIAPKLAKFRKSYAARLKNKSSS